MISENFQPGQGGGPMSAGTAAMLGRLTGSGVQGQPQTAQVPGLGSYGNDGMAVPIGGSSGMRNISQPSFPGNTGGQINDAINVPHPPVHRPVGGGGAQVPNVTGGGLNPAAPNPMKDPLPPRYAAMVAAGQPEAAVRARWAQFLGGQLPAQNGVPGAPGPQAPPPQAGPPGPAQGPPQAPLSGAPTWGPAYGGGYGGGQQQGGSAFDPGGTWGPPQQQGGQQAYSYDDPFSQVLSAIPVMNLNAQKQISNAMASAGFGGNRWSSSAENAAGQIGAENALQQNAMLTNAMFDSANRAQDRSLAAAQGSTALGGLLDQMAQNRLTTPFALGQYEQGRQDDFSKMAFQDWQQNKLGWFPYLLQAAASQGAGSPGSVVPITSAGSPGLLDYAQGLGGLAGIIGGLFGGGG